MINIKNLNKKYRNKIILDNINLNIEKGKIIGLLGPNGSGKTTLMKILLNITKEDNGEIYINNEKKSEETNKYISFLPDAPFIDKDLNINEARNYFKFFYTDFNDKKFENLINKLNLNLKDKIKNLSKGNIEKLNLILILSRDAKIYILDEPIAGVDIVTRNEILKLIIENISDESTAIISTHLIKDIEHIFDQVMFLKDANIDKIYNVEDIRINKNISVEDLYLEYFGGKNHD
ncbi:ATP-binding cassette domain-containing protein [Pseudostreptobacillus sp.]